VAWQGEHADGIGRLACAEQHTGYARFCRATWDHPPHAAVINAAGRQVLGIGWHEGDHSTRHRGERPGGGQVYPVTSEPERDQGRCCCTGRSAPSAAKHGAERDDLRGRKRVLLIISPCK
jgi:hypothetical protein